MPIRVLDTSALLVLRGDEPGADRVAGLLAAANKGRTRLLASFMTRMELLYLIRRDEGEDAARSAMLLLDSLPLEWVSCEADILDAAASIKASGGLSLADSWIAATAQIRGATLVHRDPEYEALTEIEQELLG